MNLAFETEGGKLNFIGCDDINQSNIKRFGVPPLLGSMLSTLTYVKGEELHAGYYGFKIFFPKDTPNHYIISTGVNHHPAEWAGGEFSDNPFNRKSLFELLNDKYLKDLQEGRAILLLDSSFEGYHEHWLWDFFHKECKKHNIPPPAVVFISGNMIVESEYNKYVHQNNITVENRIKTIGYPHFQIDVLLNAVNRVNLYEQPRLPNFNDHIEYKTTNPNKIKTYACLNKRTRPHRIWFHSYLYHANLLDKGLVSMNDYNYFDQNEWEGKLIQSGEWFDPPKKLLPTLVYDTPNNTLGDPYYITRYNDQVCLDTWVSVIPEAAYGDSEGTLFLSEKIFKPIVCHHPFIVMGNKGSLAKLRELGYKTFDGFIDESYDNLSTWERFEAIIETIKKVDAIKDKIEWYKSIQDIIEHNYEVIRKNVLTNRPLAFTELQKYYSRYFKILI
jgi:hypothetical protein